MQPYPNYLFKVEDSASPLLKERGGGVSDFRRAPGVSLKGGGE